MLQCISCRCSDYTSRAAVEEAINLWTTCLCSLLPPYVKLTSEPIYSLFTLFYRTSSRTQGINIPMVSVGDPSLTFGLVWRFLVVDFVSVIFFPNGWKELGLCLELFEGPVSYSVCLCARNAGFLTMHTSENVGRALYYALCWAMFRGCVKMTFLGNSQIISTCWPHLGARLFPLSHFVFWGFCIFLLYCMSTSFAFCFAQGCAHIAS